MQELDTDAGERQNVFQAALMNFLNPNPYLFWSVLAGPILIAGWRAHPLNGAAFLFGFYGVMISALAVLIVLFASARQLGPRVSRILLGVSALGLLGFGAFQLWQGVTGA
jgi:threonine/homoserine/homoserine lactone efflux protein